MVLRQTSDGNSEDSENPYHRLVCHTYVCSIDNFNRGFSREGGYDTPVRWTLNFFGLVQNRVVCPSFYSLEGSVPYTVSPLPRHKIGFCGDETRLNTGAALLPPKNLPSTTKHDPVKTHEGQSIIEEKQKQGTLHTV